MHGVLPKHSNTSHTILITKLYNAVESQFFSSPKIFSTLSYVLNAKPTSDNLVTRNNQSVYDRM